MGVPAEQVIVAPLTAAVVTALITKQASASANSAPVLGGALAHLKCEGSVGAHEQTQMQPRELQRQQAETASTAPKLWEHSAADTCG